MFRNEMPRFEILSEGALETVERGWRRLVSEIGIQFDHPRALDLFRAAGCEVEEARVRFDPDFLLEQAARAPREFDMRARNPEFDLHIGGDSMIFAPTQGPPFVRMGGVRRDATLADLQRFIMLTQTYPELDTRHLRAQRHGARFPSPGHEHVADPALRQGLRGRAHVRGRRG